MPCAHTGTDKAMPKPASMREHSARIVEVLVKRFYDRDGE